jgi:ankyrin repeat protein
MNTLANRIEMLRAAQEDDLTTLNLMISSGCHVNDADDQKFTLLHQAVMAGQVNAVRNLALLGADLNAEDVYGRTPLSRSISTKQINISLLMIECGADANKKNKLFPPPLQFAAQAGDVMGCLVLKAGAAELDDASMELDPDISHILQYSPLQAAAAGGFGKLVIRCLEESFDPDTVEDIDQTAIELANFNNRDDIVRVMQAWKNRELASRILTDIEQCKP